MVRATVAILDKLGFSATQIAWLYSCTGIAAIVSPVLVGVVADRYFSAQKVLAFLHATGAAVLLAVTQQTVFSSFIPLLLLYALFYMPTVAITNRIAFRNLADSERDFPRVRVLGTIGWIFSGIAVGFVPAMLGFDDISTTNIPFVVTAVASILLASYALSLPDTPPQSRGEVIDLKELLGLNALGMLRDKAFAVFAICSFLFCIPLAFYYQFANGYLTQVGLQNATGWMSLGQVSEIFFVLSLPFLLKRFAIKVGGRVLEHFALVDPTGFERFDGFAVWGVGAGIILAVMLLFVSAFRGIESLGHKA